MIFDLHAIDTCPLLVKLCAIGDVKSVLLQRDRQDEFIVKNRPIIDLAALIALCVHPAKRLQIHLIDSLVLHSNKLVVLGFLVHEDAHAVVRLSKAKLISCLEILTPGLAQQVPASEQVHSHARLEASELFTLVQAHAVRDLPF